jgi:hypothetical protein
MEKPRDAGLGTLLFITVVSMHRRCRCSTQRGARFVPFLFIPMGGLFMRSLQFNRNVDDLEAPCLYELLHALPLSLTLNAADLCCQ